MRSVRPPSSCPVLLTLLCSTVVDRGDTGHSSGVSGQSGPGQPIRGQYPGHVIALSQSEASILVSRCLVTPGAEASDLTSSGLRTQCRLRGVHPDTGARVGRFSSTENTSYKSFVKNHFLSFIWQSYTNCFTSEPNLQWLYKLHIFSNFHLSGACDPGDAPGAVYHYEAGSSVLASDWLRVITWPGYWPLIGVSLWGEVQCPARDGGMRRWRCERRGGGGAPGASQPSCHSCHTSCHTSCHSDQRGSAWPSPTRMMSPPPPPGASPGSSSSGRWRWSKFSFSQWN